MEHKLLESLAAVGLSRCRTCGKDKPIAEFARDASRPRGIQYLCRLCLNGRNRVRYADGTSRQNNTSRRYRLGVSFTSLLARFGNECNVCRSVATLVVDHAHDTNKVRGLLCHHCNVGLGFFKDDTATLASAIKYLVERS